MGYMEQKQHNNIKDYLSVIGKKGGSTTKKRHGSKHFSDAGKKGAAKRWNKNNPPVDN
jgi:general stress protein YciG